VLSLTACPKAHTSSGEKDVAKKVHEVIAMLEAHGWRQVRERGSHRHFKHSDVAPMVTVAGKRSDTMRPGTLANIRRKSGIEEMR
jgi:predicted RNA binding protein YcfA (HicA-like mRNA interferase family)